MIELKSSKIENLEYTIRIFEIIVLDRLCSIKFISNLTARSKFL